MHLEAQELLDALHSRGLRLTAARRAVCEVLARAHDEHLSTSDLHGLAESAAGGPIDPSTVYRTVDVLEQLGLVHHVHLGHGPGALHLTDGRPHHHLVCDECGVIADVPIEVFEPLFSVLEADHGFAVSAAHFGIAGTCTSCREQSKNSSE